MYYKHQKAFTMLELIFVIVVIGILSAVAVPKFAATRDDAVISRARTTIASVRSALATERQKRILRGNFNNTIALPTTTTDVFAVKWGGTDVKLLEYGVKQCTLNVTRECWTKTNATTFTFTGPQGNTCKFVLNNNKLDRSTCSVAGLTDL